MTGDLSLSTDQVAAFVELARHGTLRLAADALHITEQGLRNRLVALEGRLGVQLYRKQRGPRRSEVLTPQGREFLPHALAFLDGARRLAELFAGSPEPREIHVAATQYLILYVLIDAVRRFRAAHPRVAVRLSNRTEAEIEEHLRTDPDLSFGVAAPYESSAELEYRHLVSHEWSFIAPPRHPLLRRPRLRLRDLADVPLIVFERGSTGRRHVMDAFHAQGLSPRVDMETTNTEITVRMVEAGLGVSVVPMMPDGSVTRGRRVSARSLAGEIQPIHSGILTRRGESLSPTSRAFVEFLAARGGVRNRPPAGQAQTGAR